MSPFAHSLAVGAVRATGAAPMHVLRRRFPTSSLPSGTHELLSADGLTVFRGSWRGVRIFVPDARRPELSDPRPSQIRAAARNHFPGRRTSLAGHLRCRGAQERGRRGARARTGPGTAIRSDRRPAVAQAPARAPDHVARCRAGGGRHRRDDGFAAGHRSDGAAVHRPRRCRRGGAPGLPGGVADFCARASVRALYRQRCKRRSGRGDRCGARRRGGSRRNSKADLCRRQFCESQRRYADPPAPIAASANRCRTQGLRARRRSVRRASLVRHQRRARDCALPGGAG